MKNLHMGEASARPRVRELVINWHITEACNFSCRYCYAKWDGTEKELIHDWERTQKLLSEIASFFAPSYQKEAPRLCRGGSRSLTFQEVVHRRDFQS